jgi:phosphoribosylglycinamide formyltransferase-1
MIRIAVLASGSGTNLQALLDADLVPGEVVLVASDKLDAPALGRSRKKGISSIGLDRKTLGKKALEQTLEGLLDDHAVDLIVLAGFLTILSAQFVNAHRNRIVNIHPSLLPSFGGKGYYGERVHEAVLKRGVKISGATVHLVTEEADEGPILAQQALSVADDDTPSSLGQRILTTIEWTLLPKTVQQYCQKLEEEMQLETYLKGLRYPGRGIACGMSEEGKALLVYFITARSKHSKNRMLVAQNEAVRTEALDESLLVDPSLIIYRAIDRIGNAFVVANGDQSEAILASLAGGRSFEEGLADSTYEPDAPNYTPRISALFQAEGPIPYTLSILRRREDGSCEHAFFPYAKLQAGEGHLIHTYEREEEPLPSFAGEPRRVFFTGNGEQLARSVWQSLDERVRVGLCVKEIDLDTHEVQTIIINAEERR